jgi:pyrroline-5-carboxylate reductase
MNENPVIAIIGPGVMGEAILCGLLRNGLTPRLEYSYFGTRTGPQR